MNFLASIVLYLLTGFALGWGMLLAVKGNLWLLAAGLLVYVLALTKIGCLPKAH